MFEVICKVYKIWHVEIYRDSHCYHKAWNQSKCKVIVKGVMCVTIIHGKLSSSWIYPICSVIGLLVHIHILHKICKSSLWLCSTTEKMWKHVMYVTVMYVTICSHVGVWQACWCINMPLVIDKLTACKTATKWRLCTVINRRQTVRNNRFY